MRDTLKELMEKLGVGYELSPYETFPWSAYDGAKALTCSAEVRMNPDGSEIEAEIQILLDEPIPGKPSVDQVLWLKALPQIQGKWTITELRIKGENWVSKVFNWDEKACNFFRACTTELSLGNVPDIEALIERELKEKDRYGDQRGSGSGKAPKIRPAQLLDMKRGQGF